MHKQGHGDADGTRSPVGPAPPPSWRLLYTHHPADGATDGVGLKLAVEAPGYLVDLEEGEQRVGEEKPSGALGEAWSTEQRCCGRYGNHTGVLVSTDSQPFSRDDQITELEALQSEPGPPAPAGHTGLGSRQGSG